MSGKRGIYFLRACACDEPFIFLQLFDPPLPRQLLLHVHRVHLQRHVRPGGGERAGFGQLSDSLSAMLRNGHTVFV